MDDVEEVEESVSHEAVHQFMKMIIGTAVGYIAAKMSQNAYETFVMNRHS